jgi:predicted RNase H-like nuclease
MGSTCSQHRRSLPRFGTVPATLVPVRVRGVDGFKRGWVVIDLENGVFVGARVAAVFRELCTDDVRVIGVDIPIGLVDGTRDADGEARHALVGRRSSVFSAPPRCALAATTFAEANLLSRSTGRGLSQQSFALLPKIREVDEFTSDARIFEVHPELSFLAMADGVPLAHAKKTWAGQALRRELLERVGILIPRDLGAAGAVPTDDVLDAAAAAWSASRIALGRAVPYPREPTQHYGSRAIAIWT